jgi:4-amino-4-deoxy-L-arabinose transferase-like glycosyltransferase
MLALILDLILLLGLLISAVVFGKIILSRTKLTFVSPLEQTLFAAGTGLAVFAYTVVGLAAIGGLYPVVARIAYGFSLLISLIYIYRHTQLSNLPAHLPRLTRLEQLFIALLLIIAFLALIAVLAPPTDWDALDARLEVPKRYIQAHGYIYLPSGYAYYTQFVESLYILALLLKDDILARLVNLALGGLSTLAVYALARRAVERGPALLAALIFVSSPLVVFVFVEVFIEAGTVFYCLLAILAILTWRARGDRRWLWFSAALVGICLSIKYYTVILAPVLVWAVLERAWQTDRRPVKEIIRLLLTVGLIALIFPLPWLIKSTIFVGDPVFPVISAWLGRWGRGIAQANWALYGMGSNLLDYLLLPWRMTFGDRFGVPKPGFLFLLLLPLLFGLPRTPAQVRWMGGVILVWFVFWANSAGQTVRFFLPGLALLSVVLVAALSYLPQWAGKLRPLIIALITAIVLYQLVWPVYFASWALPFVSGQQSRHEYLMNRLDIYPIADYANNNLPGTAKIATIWEERGYYFDKPLVSGQSPDGAFLHQFVLGDDPSKLAEALLSRGLTHLIINEVLERDFEYILRDRYMYGVETHTLLVYDSAFRGCFLRPLVKHKEIILYQVLAESTCSR